MRVNLCDLIPGRLYHVRFLDFPPGFTKNYIFKRKDGSTYIWVNPFSHIEIRCKSKYFIVSEKK